MVRLIFVALAVVTFGVFVLVYLAAWIVIPEEGEGASIAENDQEDGWQLAGCAPTGPQGRC